MLGIRIDVVAPTRSHPPPSAAIATIGSKNLPHLLDFAAGADAFDDTSKAVKSDQSPIDSID